MHDPLALYRTYMFLSRGNAHGFVICTSSNSAEADVSRQMGDHG